MFSFIVPVYNVEQYICECVDSILSQKYTNLELILVDDGSTDKSAQICNDYAGMDQRVKVVHQENGGLSAARNVGIDLAQGEYILFVDSDDYIADDCLHQIAQCCVKKPDIIFLETTKIFPDGKKIPLGVGMTVEKLVGKDNSEVLKYISGLAKFPASAWSKAIRRTLFYNNELRFELGMLSEDTSWTVELLLKAKSFHHCNCNYYYYRQKRQGSITNTISNKHINCMFKVIYRWANKDTNKNKCQKYINSFMAYEYIVILYLFAENKALQNEEAKLNLYKQQWLVKYAAGKFKIITPMLKIFGVTNTAKLVAIARNMKK